jgi:hypothetical protein
MLGRAHGGHSVPTHASPRTPRPNDQGVARSACPILSTLVSTSGEETLVSERCIRFTECNLASDAVRYAGSWIDCKSAFNRLRFEQATGEIPDDLKETG